MELHASPSLDRNAIACQAAESRRRQGLPDYVEDPATVARVVGLILAGRTRLRRRFITA